MVVLGGGGQSYERGTPVLGGYFVVLELASRGGGHRMVSSWAGGRNFHWDEGGKYCLSVTTVTTVNTVDDVNESVWKESRATVDRVRGGGDEVALQGCLAHQKTPTPLGPS